MEMLHTTEHVNICVTLPKAQEGQKRPVKDLQSGLSSFLKGVTLKMFILDRSLLKLSSSPKSTTITSDYLSVG